uniref:Synaptogyrin 1a n=1 Tax=Kryptolebias marmoratus TaxID=37003 RepID=A0A3Q3B366_KRYMA
MDGFQAYGAGKAGGAFDPLTFIRQPQTVLRIFCWVFSIVVLGCIANEGYINRPEAVEEFCIFNQNQNACNYAVAVGMLGFLCSAGFLALDVYFPQISGVKDRKKAVMADIVVSGERHHALFCTLPVQVLIPTCNVCFSCLCSSLVSHLVRGFLFSGQSVAGF